MHELVVLPTLAPHLARPEYLDPTPDTPIVLPQPRSHQLEHGVTIVEGQLSKGMFLVLSPLDIVSDDAFPLLQMAQLWRWRSLPIPYLLLSSLLW